MADGQDSGLLGATDGDRGKVVEGDVHRENITHIHIIIILFEALHGGLLSSLSGVEKSGSWGVFVCVCLGLRKMMWHEDRTVVVFCRWCGECVVL